ncbi:tail fiber domain-containing protein [Streptomyces sp. NPDC051555]|uniref:tail fiber domain-containing protein n=1 Tax=Streptomyces sp. NPDC051555 TaxID=3365657 RepID=UPI0037BD507D
MTSPADPGTASRASPPRLTVNSLADPATTAETLLAVNAYEVLHELSVLPVSTWRYAWEPPGIRHLGPMSQDFKAAFGLGEGHSAIDCVDINGVTLLAVQALHRTITALQDDVAALRQAAHPSSDRGHTAAGPES